jgi:hypothetical protein
MKLFRFFATAIVALYLVSCNAQTSVKGNLVLPIGQDKEFIIRTTKVVLIASKERDTVAINDDLTFNFENTAHGKGYLYLVSPTLPGYTEYKFRIRKNKPTVVALQYGKFTNAPRPQKTPEEREAALERAALFARIAFDFIILFQSFHH